MPSFNSNLICFSLVCACACAQGRDLFVSTAGTDTNDGSHSAPWATVQHALDSVQPGDTVHAAAGTYTEKIIAKVSGTSDAPIVLKAEPGAVLSGKGIKGENVLLIEDLDYIHVVGFEIRDHKANDGSGIRVRGGCAGIELRNNRIHEIRGRDAMGITVYGSNKEKPVSGIIIDGNEIFDCDPAKSEALTLNGNVTGFKVTNNSVHDLNNIGIDFIGGEDTTGDSSKAARNGLCSGNKVYRCRSRYGDGYAAGIYVDGGVNITVENNIVTQCDLGIEVGAENKGTVAKGNRVRNNMIFHNDKAGIVFGGYEKGTGRVQDCEFTGNICYQNNRHKADHNGEIWVQFASGNIVTGNTFVVNGSDSPLACMDKGAGTNKFSGNKYYTDAGAEDAFFVYHGNDVNGFAAWRAATKGDLDSVFGPVEVKLPAVE